MIPACCNAVGGRPVTGNGDGPQPVLALYAAITAPPGGPILFPPSIFVQIPLPTTGPVAGLIAAPPNIGFPPLTGGDYDVEYGVVLTMGSVPPAILSVQAVLSLNGNPGGPGAAIVPTGDQQDLISDQGGETVSLHGGTLEAISDTDTMGLWVRIDGGPPGGHTMSVLVASMEAVRV